MVLMWWNVICLSVPQASKIPVSMFDDRLQIFASQRILASSNDSVSKSFRIKQFSHFVNIQHVKDVQHGKTIINRASIGKL